ncbi:unnamed protein product [Trichogramma brassicae]|uniref:Integrase catalytic domain-containing protein n=1 Tax=Trichogramma brassicae TaxID=86971 RepID=A0A6H5HRK2_9HYME|nr:unnamed protein product [Trichogramma brassicae]
MYRQILIDERDVDWQRTLWSPCAAEPARHYRLNTVTYGTTCAPYLALRTIQQLCTDEGARFPTVQHAILNDRYVDDILPGGPDLATARELRDELIQLMKAGGFTLRKWVANDPRLLEELEADDCLRPAWVLFTNEDPVKELGVAWNPQRDTLSLRYSTSNREPRSKREVLAALARIYDPCGWVAPATLLAKMLVQDLWRAHLDWDDELPDNAIREWTAIRQGLDHSPARASCCLPRRPAAALHMLRAAHAHRELCRMDRLTHCSPLDTIHRADRQLTAWPSTNGSLDGVALGGQAICLHVAAQEVPVDDHITRFSDLGRLLRFLVRLRRWIRHKLHRRPTPAVLSPMTYAELNGAFKACVRLSQSQSSERELTIIRAGLAVPVRSPLASLDSFICSEGLLRVGGRLHQSQLPFDQKHPPIVDGSNALAALIIGWAHLQTLHGGFRATYVQVLQRVWLINGKRAIRRHIHHCVICIASRARPMAQIMASLPPQRVTPCRAFARTGLDYAGPFQVWSSRRHGVRATKAWVAVFVCMTTKAVHLELAGDLSTASLLGALTRFSRRRGRPSEICSDNATHFHRADLDIREALNNPNLNWTTVSDRLTEQGIKWNFIPPSVPHFGGLWEAAVKSFKAHLKLTLGPRRVTFEEMSTLLVSIEAVLNSRPLCPVTNEADDLHVLTPGHFLVGGPLLALPEQEVDIGAIDHLHHWQLIQALRAVFWKKWSREYLNTLQQRTKWSRRRDSLTLGDMVLLMDPALLQPSGRWPLGRVIEVHHG